MTYTKDNINNLTFKVHYSINGSNEMVNTENFELLEACINDFDSIYSDYCDKVR